MAWSVPKSGPGRQCCSGLPKTHELLQVNTDNPKQPQESTISQRGLGQRLKPRCQAHNALSHVFGWGAECRHYMKRCVSNHDRTTVLDGSERSAPAMSVPGTPKTPPTRPLDALPATAATWLPGTPVTPPSMPSAAPEQAPTRPLCVSSVKHCPTYLRFFITADELAPVHTKAISAVMLSGISSRSQTRSHQ